MKEKKIMDISIVTPFYKGNQYMESLFKCVRLNAQNVPSLYIELVLVNDSPDTDIYYNPKWADGYEVHIIVNETNLGIQQSRSNGIHAARGKYVILLDQDDLLEDNAIKTQYESIEDGDVVVANGFDQNPLNHGIIYHSAGHQNMVLDRRYYYSIGNMIVSPGQCMIKKKAFPKEWLESGIKNNGSDDLLLWLLMLPPRYKWKINTNSIYTHVDTGENVSSDFQKMYNSSMEVLNWMISVNSVTEHEKKMFERRFRMRRMYEGKKKYWKAMAYVAFPDMAIELLKMKIR